MQEFDRIYFDSSALISGGWPRPDFLEEIFGLAKELSIELCIPEPVELELESVWLRRLHDAWQENVGKKIEGVVRKDLIVTSHWDRVQEDYRSAATKLKERWAIASTPYVNQTLSDTFRDFVKLSPPYKNRFGGFRDIVIHLSIVAHLLARPASGVIVADDWHFADFESHQPEKSWREALGVSLEFIVAKSGSLGMLKEELSRLAEPTNVRKWRDEREQDARKALRESEAKMIEFMSQRLQAVGILGARITITDIGRIRTSLRQDTAENSPVNITAYVDVTIRALPPVQSEPMRTAYLPPQWATGTVERREGPGQFVLRATATWRGGKIEDVTPTGADLIDWSPQTKIDFFLNWE